MRFTKKGKLDMRCRSSKYSIQHGRPMTNAGYPDRRYKRGWRVHKDGTATYDESYIPKPDPVEEFCGNILAILIIIFIFYLIIDYLIN